VARLGQGLALEWYPAVGTPRGMDLSVEVDHPAAGDLLCKAARTLAEEHQLQIFDPQIGRTVTTEESAIIREHLRESAAFSEGGALSSGGSISPPGRLWLTLAGGLVLLLLLARALTCSS